MLKFIEEYGKHVEIAGYNEISIRSPESFFQKIEKNRPPNVDMQFFDADRIATWEHLYFAVLNALTVFKNGENISMSLGMEILLFAAAEKQIVKATKIVGISRTSRRLAVVIVGDKSENVKSTLSLVTRVLGRQTDEKVLDLADEKTKLIFRVFNLESIGLKTLMRDDNDLKRAMIDLLIEKMALSVTKR